MALHDIDDERLDAHVRARITPEFVDWVKRKLGVTSYAIHLAKTSAMVNYILGAKAQQDFLASELTKLLTEAQDPEFR